VKRRDSLVGLSAVAAHALFPSVLARFARAQSLGEGDSGWQPEWLPAERAALIAQAADTIIPRTDTPGARDARVHVFVDLALRDCYTPDEQRTFLEGLEALDARCRADAAPFEERPLEDRTALLEQLERESLGRGEGPRDSFIRILKDLTVTGYFTSQPGATQALAYDPVPVRYRGCVDLEPEQKGWAT